MDNTNIITIDSNLTFLTQKIANKMPYHCKPWCNAEGSCVSPNSNTETKPIYFNSPLVLYDDINEYFKNNPTLQKHLLCFVYKHYNVNECNILDPSGNNVIQNMNECKILKRIEKNLKVINADSFIIFSDKHDSTPTPQYVLCENNCDWDVVAETLAAIITATIMTNRLLNENELLQILNESEPQKHVTTEEPILINPSKIVSANYKKKMKDDCISWTFQLPSGSTKLCK